MLLCRTDRYLSPDIKAKLALYCDVPEEAVITAKDVDSIYEVPLVLSGEGLDAIILKALGPRRARAATWRPGSAWSSASRTRKGEVTIGIVGKYVSFEDSYKSLNEALTHGGFGNDVTRGAALGGGRGARVGQRRGQAGRASTASWCPGGFGARGTGGMVAAAEYARRTGTPYFGICYGFQWAVTEYARNVCGLTGANSTEVDENAAHKVIYKLQDLLGRRRPGRHHAPRLLHLRAPARLPGRARSTAPPRSASATATATSSTRNTRAA